MKPTKPQTPFVVPNLINHTPYFEWQKIKEPKWHDISFHLFGKPHTFKKKRPSHLFMSNDPLSFVSVWKMHSDHLYLTWLFSQGVFLH